MFKRKDTFCFVLVWVCTLQILLQVDNPVLGRFGNQVEQYIGTLKFARSINRTLVLPPFLEYPLGEAKAKVVPFESIFEVEALRRYHRVVTMEEFMEKIAPKVWSKEKREVFCWGPRQSLNDRDSFGCHAKEGNPFGPFWDHFKVDFTGDNYFGDIGHGVENPTVINFWKDTYPIEEYPVIAFSSAPASFPVASQNRQLQAYFKWSTKIRDEAKTFVERHLPRPFIGIHLRNDIDWEKACNHVDSTQHFFASAQCTGDTFQFGRPSKEICLPPREQILKDVYREVKRIDAKSVFVSTDKDPMLVELNELFNDTINIRKLNKDDPYLSLAILDLSDHLIANCMSTYSAFSVRQRRTLSKSSRKSLSFFGFDELKREWKEGIAEKTPNQKSPSPPSEKDEL